MGSGAMIYIPSFIKIGSAIPKLIGGDHISLVSFFQNKESRLKTFSHVQIRKLFEGATLCGTLCR
jgi:hypothetical protein